jgi:4-azaleucine resistance transporter AzlC
MLKSKHRSPMRITSGLQWFIRATMVYPGYNGFSGISSEMVTTSWHAFKDGAQHTIPLIIGAIPFGIVFGTLGPASGLSVTATLAMSVLVFAGSAQFIALGLLASGTPVSLVIAVTFVVNLRHLLYAVTLMPCIRHLPLSWRTAMAFWLTDETFAVVVNRMSVEYRSNFHWYYLGSALSMYGNWQLCTIIGLAAGKWLPGIENWGLDVAMAVTFIGIVAPQITTSPKLICSVTACACSLLWHNWPHHTGLIAAALTAVALAMLAEHFQKKNNPHNDGSEQLPEKDTP